MLGFWLIYPVIILWFLLFAAILAHNFIGALLFWASAIVYLLAVCISFFFESGLVKRLSNFFIAFRIPFVRQSIIAQKSSRRNLKKLSCKEIFSELRYEKTRLPKSLKRDWTYLAITHQTVINHVIKSGVIDEKGLKIHRISYQSSLRMEHRLLTGKRCRKCPNRKMCYFKKKAKQKRGFYWIQFHTKSTE